MAKVLRAAGSGLEQVIKISVYLTDMTNFAAMNEVYIEFFDRNAMPARTCVAWPACTTIASINLNLVDQLEINQSSPYDKLYGFDCAASAKNPIH
ncbi:RutC-like superfamily protein [Abortiporus biennis]